LEFDHRFVALTTQNQKGFQLIENYSYSRDKYHNKLNRAVAVRLIKKNLL
jgi:hypothetical protein